MEDAYISRMYIYKCDVLKIVKYRMHVLIVLKATVQL